MSDAVTKEPHLPLTPRQVEHAKPRERDHKLADTATRRLKYRFGGKERRLLLGAHPEVGLKRALELRDDAKQALRRGLDPGFGSERARPLA